MEALIEDEKAMDKGVADSVKNHKRQHDDDDNDEDPSAGPNQDNLTQDLLLGPAYNLLKGTCSSCIELEYNFQECFNALTDKLDWNNPKGDCYPFDLSKPLPLQGRPSHLTVAADYFFNNNLEFLKSSDPERSYTTSITKTKAARYEIVGFEDMVPTLWGPIKHGYNKDAEKGTKHWGEKRQLWHRSQLNKFSKHNVYSTQNIISVVSVKVERLHGYGHLDEIVEKRVDRQLYKFKEGDFVDQHLTDIKDMLLLAVQHRLFHLNDHDIVDFIVALPIGDGWCSGVGYGDDSSGGCHVTDEAKGSIIEETVWKRLEKDLCSKGQEIFGRNSCLIARNTLPGLKTCIQVYKYMHAGQEGPSDACSTNDHEEPQSSVRRKNKAKRQKQFGKSVARRPTLRGSANGNRAKQYTPCDCKSGCGKDCPCSKSSNCCARKAAGTGIGDVTVPSLDAEASNAHAMLLA
ncbi:integrase, catalytic region, zinc finger, CCHC-type containing protein, partial [Tanacetum coccineum]